MSKYDKDLDKVLSKLDKMDERLNKIEEKVFIMKILFKVGKVVGAIALAIITLKFGSVIPMIKGMF